MKEYNEVVLCKMRDFIVNNGKDPKFLIISSDILCEIAADYEKYTGSFTRTANKHDMFNGLIVSQVSYTITNFLEVA